MNLFCNESPNNCFREVNRVSIQTRNLSRSGVVGLLTALFAISVWAADVTGRIRGTVTDPSGAVVVGANVTATNAQTGVAYHATSNSTGGYEFLQLPVGTYN